MLDKGDAAPDFDLSDEQGRRWRLAELKGKRVIVYFYPADDTPGCTAEACDFRDARAEFARAGYVVLGISPQGDASHRAFSTKYGLNFPLLIDDRFEAAESYGVVADQPRFHGDIPLEVHRSTFVVDEDGRIVEALYGVKGQGHVGALKELLSI
jgi:peroxiredoxin Q/BCP